MTVLTKAIKNHDLTYALEIIRGQSLRARFYCSIGVLRYDAAMILGGLQELEYMYIGNVSATLVDTYNSLRRRFTICRWMGILEQTDMDDCPLYIQTPLALALRIDGAIDVVEALLDAGVKIELRSTTYRYRYAVLEDDITSAEEHALLTFIRNIYGFAQDDADRDRRLAILKRILQGWQTGTLHQMCVDTISRCTKSYILFEFLYGIRHEIKNNDNMLVNTIIDIIFYYEANVNELFSNKDNHTFLELALNISDSLTVKFLQKNANIFASYYYKPLSDAQILHCLHLADKHEVPINLDAMLASLCEDTKKHAQYLIWRHQFTKALPDLQPMVLIQQKMRQVYNFVSGTITASITEEYQKLIALDPEMAKHEFDVKFCCPIKQGGVLIFDPVKPKGSPQVYERACIASWFDNHNTDPITGLELTTPAQRKLESHYPTYKAIIFELRRLQAEAMARQNIPALQEESCAWLGLRFG